MKWKSCIVNRKANTKFCVKYTINTNPLPTTFESIIYHLISCKLKYIITVGTFPSAPQTWEWYFNSSTDKHNHTCTRNWRVKFMVGPYYVHISWKSRLQQHTTIILVESNSSTHLASFVFICRPLGHLQHPGNRLLICNYFPAQMIQSYIVQTTLLHSITNGQYVKQQHWIIDYFTC